MAIGSFIPALVLGVGFAWFVAGIPVGEGWGAFNVLEVFVAPGKSQGELLLIELTNMFALCGGLLFVALFLTHGAFFVALKTRGVIHDRARHYGKILGPVAIGLLLVFVLWGNLRMDVTGMAGIPWFPGNGALGAFQTWAWVAGILALLALSFSWFMNLKQRDGWAFIGTSVATAMLVAMVFCHMYPGLGFNTPSLIDMTSAASSHNTLFLMTIVALCCVPMVIAYTAWSYFFVFRRRLNTVSIPALSVTTPRHPARSRRVRSLNNR
jgi:cytochrome d ubiquinol oxidase subunit II